MRFFCAFSDYTVVLTCIPGIDPVSGGMFGIDASEIAGSPNGSVNLIAIGADVWSMCSPKAGNVTLLLNVRPVLAVMSCGPRNWPDSLVSLFPHPLFVPDIIKRSPSLWHRTTARPWGGLICSVDTTDAVSTLPTQRRHSRASPSARSQRPISRGGKPESLAMLGLSSTYLV